MVTAAAVAHVNRLPVLLLPGDVFANRAARSGAAAGRGFRRRHRVGVNDCFRPVSRYFDRITRPEQLLTALPRAMHGADRSGRLRPGHAGLLPGRAGRGVRLSRRLLRAARLAHAPPAPDARRARRRGRRCCAAPKRPLIVAGGGVLYAERRARRSTRFAERARHPGRRDPGRQGRARRGTIRCNVGSIGVTGTLGRQRAGRARPTWCSRVGTRLQDFTTGSLGAVPATRAHARQLNVQRLRCRQARRAAAGRRRQAALEALVGGARRLRARRRPGQSARAGAEGASGTPPSTARPRATQRRAAVRRPGDRRGATRRRATTASWSAPPAGCRASCTSCGGAGSPAATTSNTAISCMGYEIAGGLGVKMAQPEREVIVHGRRRQLPDDELRARDLGDARARSSSSSCSTTAASAASTACSARPAARASTTCSSDAAPRGAARRSTSPPTPRSLGAHRREGRRHRRARGGAGARRAPRPHLRHRHRHRPACRRPRPAAPGGTWPCPRSRARAEVRAARARLRRRRAQRSQRLGRTEPMTIRIGTNPIAWINDDMPELGGETPLETCLAEAQRGRLRRHRARQQVPARRRRRCRRCSAATGSTLVSGWYSAELLRRARSRTRSRRCGRTSTCSRRWAARCWSAPRPRTPSTARATAAGRRGPVLARRRVAGVRRSASTGVADCMAAPGRARSPTTTTWARWSRRRRRSTGCMAAHRPAVVCCSTPATRPSRGADPARAGPRAIAARITHVHAKDVRARRDGARRRRATQLPRRGGRRRLHRARRRLRRLSRRCCADAAPAIRAGSSSRPSRIRPRPIPLTYARMGYATCGAILRGRGCCELRACFEARYARTSA